MKKYDDLTALLKGNELRAWKALVAVTKVFLGKN
jgi:hypothetical protein